MINTTNSNEQRNMKYTNKVSEGWKIIHRALKDRQKSRKSIGTGLLGLLGDVEAAVDIDVQIDIKRVKCSCSSPSGYPTRVTATDNNDGTFTLEINAIEAGVYSVDVRTDDTPIIGSPFRLKVHQTGEKEKVKLTGVGLHSGLLSDAVGVFQIHTHGAGPGKLEVQLDGPKGGFQVDISTDPSDRRVVVVNYNPLSHGVFNVNVFWDGYHVPGSPRLVFLAPDEQALEKWLRNPTLLLREDNNENQ